jgi:hypothetical protein
MFERHIVLQPESPAAPHPQATAETGARTTASPGRRASQESAVSAASSASARRVNKIMEVVTGNGTRRAFKSPDGKVLIKMTSFRQPSTVDMSASYIGNVVNPRSKSPAAQLTQQQKKKQEDDYVRAIVAANRKAAEERVANEHARRRGTGKSAASSGGTPGKAPVSPTGRVSAKGMHIAPAEKERRPSISPNRYRPIAELDLFRVEPHSPARDHPMLSFISFRKVLPRLFANND